MNILKSVYNTMIDWLINYKGMLTFFGLFYANWFGNRFYCTFIFLFVLLFPKSLRAQLYDINYF